MPKSDFLKPHDYSSRGESAAIGLLPNGKLNIVNADDFPEEFDEDIAEQQAQNDEHHAHKLFRRVYEAPEDEAGEDK